MDTFKQQLIQLNACSKAVRWVENKTLEQAWIECERGDWMLWLAQKCNVDLRILILAKVECAKLVQHLMKDQRSLDALKVAEQFAKGKATMAELGDAVVNADAAYHAANRSAFYHIYINPDNCAAADAAFAAIAAVTTNITYGASKECADICRKYISLHQLQDS